METVIIKVPLGKVEYTTDRTHGGEGNIEILAESIKAIGIIHPPAVKELKDKKGHYRIIAGRRRFAAVKMLGWKNIELKLYPEKVDDEAIALAENVNREDMHPLDEADKFKREIDSGKTAEEVAKYYARSVSGIHQRVRLTNLIDGIKTMFRDGKINLSGAALISSLPEDDQEKFLKKYGDKKAERWEITSFIHSVQKLQIKHIADKQCAKCKNRTFISTPGLFEDYTDLEDVCFDTECYAKKWKALIGNLIDGVQGETGKKIILNRGIPEFLPKKTKVIEIGDTEYEMLSQSNFHWNETKKKSPANTAYLISLDWTQTNGSYDVKAARVEYKTVERVSYSSSYKPEPIDPVKTFMIDLLPDIALEDKQRIAEEMLKRHPYNYSFFKKVEENLLHTIILKRLQEDDKESMAKLYLEVNLHGKDKEGKYYEIDPALQPYFETVFGKPFSLSEVPDDPTFEKIFRLLIAHGLDEDDLPELRDINDQWDKIEKTLFWRFVQMGKTEYISLYQEILTDAIMAEINAPAKSDDDDSEDMDFDDEDDTDFDDAVDGMMKDE